jgi:hypothetical protein
MCLILPISGQAEQKVSSGRGEVTQTLQRYVRLRLQDADWKEYSKFITWPDEPSWDCKWVAKVNKIGAPVREGQKFVIPVVYNRLGLFCYNFDFKPDAKLVTVKYELVKLPNGWKVDGPIPDYPDIDENVVIKSLNATAGDANETPERRAAAASTAQQIVEALKYDTKSHDAPEQ